MLKGPTSQTHAIFGWQVCTRDNTVLQAALAQRCWSIKSCMQAGCTFLQPAPGQCPRTKSILPMSCSCTALVEAHSDELSFRKVNLTSKHKFKENYKRKRVEVSTSLIVPNPLSKVTSPKIMQWRTPCSLKT